MIIVGNVHGESSYYPSNIWPTSGKALSYPNKSNVLMTETTLPRNDKKQQDKNNGTL